MKIANILIAALIIVAYLVLTAFYIIQSHRIEEIKDNYEKLRIDTRQQFDYKEKDIKIAKEFIFDLNRRMEARGYILDSMRDDIYTLKDKMNKIIPDDGKKRTREEIEKIKTIVKEFAEKLKIKAIKLTAIESYHICEFVDELLKEYEK